MNTVCEPLEGYITDGVNQPGLDYYNNLIDALVRTGFQTVLSRCWEPNMLVTSF